MPSGINVPLTFEIFKGDQLVRTETLAQDIIKIGKLSSSHLRIDDEGVSRMHAVIEIVGPQEIYVIDLGSTKGTLVNGQKINKARIQSGDEILLGDTRVVVKVGDAQAATAPAPSTAPRSTMMGIKTVGSPTPAAVAVPPPFASASSPAGPSTANVGGMTQSDAPPPLGGPPARGAAPAFAPAQAHPGVDPEAVEVRDGSRAIEVVAMFEDAVVETRYLQKFSILDELKFYTPRTIGLLIAGAGSLVIAFALFIAAYVTVVHETDLKDAWEKVHTSNEPFPKSHGGAPIGDAAAAILLINGFVCLFRGLIRAGAERPSRDNIRQFTIGPDPDAIVNVPDDKVPVEKFPLVRPTGETYELNFTKSMNGDVVLADKSGEGARRGVDAITLADLVSSGKATGSTSVSGAYSYTIPEGARIKIDLGETTFLVNSVPPPRRYPVPFRPDWNALVYFGGVAAGAALFLAMIFSLPPDSKSLSLDEFLNDPRLAKFIVKPPEEKQDEIPEWLKKKTQDDAGGKGKRHKDEEGKMGKKTSKNKAGLYALKGPQDNKDPHLAKQLAEEAAKNAGVLGVLNAKQGSILSSIYGRDSALGNDADNVLGGLVGTQVGEAYGVGGLGLVGSGRGGGGTGEGTIGLGSLGTIGKGGGGGSGSGYGRGAGGLGGRHAHAPDVVPGTAQVMGALDKEIIRRIIRRHINEVKFCYEKELAKKPDLYGRVMIQFTIAGTGSVVNSIVQSSTMGAPDVEQCIAGAVRRWEFPKPQGGGIVVVTYPFVLKASGGEGE